MHRWMFYFCGFLCIVVTVNAQTTQQAAPVEVISSDVFFVRENTNNEILLSRGAVSVIGVGDQIHTGQNGRAIIMISPSMEILLLPNTIYRVVDFSDDTFHANIDGIAVHRFESQEQTDLNYILETEQISVTAQRSNFAVWGIEEGLNAVSNATESIEVTYLNMNYVIESGTGFAPSYLSSSIVLIEPYHAAQVVEKAVSCEGRVQTNGSEGLRLRAGAALDYNVLTVESDNEQIKIVGTTENGLWYRIPFQSGFGWMFSSLIEADCNNLEVFPNLFSEVPERIRNASDREIEILSPYYGFPQTNSTFYR